MDRQRILREAQKIASKFSFWMVSGNISHLFGYVYETPEKKYELEIKFDDKFPKSPPTLVFHDEIKRLLGEFQLKALSNWVPEKTVVDIIEELYKKIQKALEVLKEESTAPENEEYITPDLNAYPPDAEFEEYLTPSYSEEELLYDKQPEVSSLPIIEDSKVESETLPQEPLFEEPESMSVALNTELGLIQQEYAYDQRSSRGGDINVYLTITLTKTFIIPIDFTNYPDKPIISFPHIVKQLLGDPNDALDNLKLWKAKETPHVLDILHELEKKLYFIKEIETQTKKISGEYKSEVVSDSLTRLKVHLLTYGFNEYMMDIDLESYPHPPVINLSPELTKIINIPLSELNSHKNWRDTESEPVEIIREISWLVDKNSRINFEIELIKDHYKNIEYNSETSTLNVDMKGKMKSEDLTFQFQIYLPLEYPMKMPEIKVVNEFELEVHEKIKKDLHTSFNDFFDEWSPFSYLIDLFNLISKKIFEVSVLSCVICHRIECPSCARKIAGNDSCHAECPHCEKHYHQHCWEQTIKSFGKCGFCLKPPF
ncbi:MAG: hypothetical protein ACFFB0_22255 [Promethearchaeota archaeon]